MDLLDGSDRIVERLASLNFRQAVWLFPIAYTLHVLEELPLFTSWARRYASPAFTMRDYLVIHMTGIVVAFVAPLVINRFPHRAVIFGFFAFIFTPAVCFNILFHAGATVAFGAYSPGLLTAVAYTRQFCTWSVAKLYARVCWEIGRQSFLSRWLVYFMQPTYRTTSSKCGDSEEDNDQSKYSVSQQ